MISPAAAERYSDWINPMVMKELRQGLAGRVFHISFLLIHVVMAIFLWFGIFDTSSLEGLVWIVGIFVGFLLPFTAINAVASERRAGSLDLVGLTDLSPWQIVWGKFCARACILLLFVVSILPYMVLRYFAGGLDVFSDMVNLSLVLFIGVTLTAILTGWSAFESKFLRGFILFALIIGVFVAAQATFLVRVMGGRGMGMTFSSDLFPVACSFAAPILFALAMMVVGAVTLSAPSGRLESRSRGLAWLLLALGVAQVYSSLGSSSTRGDALAWAFLANFLITLQGLTRSPSPDAIRLSPWSGRGHLARITARLLHPGWPFALLNLVACSAIVALSLTVVTETGRNSFHGMLWAGLLPMLLLVVPLAFSVVWSRFNFAFWLVVWGILGLVLVGTASMIRQTVGNDVSDFVASLSWCGIGVLSESKKGLFWVMQGLMAILALLVVLRSLVREDFFDAVGRMEELARTRREKAANP